MSTLDVVAEVLREVAPRALCAREIADLAGDRLPTSSRTPQTVVSRDLALDVKRLGSDSRFLRVGPGEFLLKGALPTALFNDTEAYVAAWSRNLITAREIAAGVVDERSIRDLKSVDVASYRQFHAFSGISVWSRALRDAGWPDDCPIWTGSPPCQPFSSAGQRKGFADDRHLWPEWFRLIQACRPACIVGEQTASTDGRAWLDVVLDDLEGAGYACKAVDIPAAGIGAPHRRQRLYYTAVLEGSALDAIRVRLRDHRTAALRLADAGGAGRAIVSASRVHDHGQPGDDAARRSEARAGSDAIDGTGGEPLADAAVTRREGSQDARTDHGDEAASTEAIDWRTAGDLEPQRSGRADDGSTGGVADTERGVRDAWRASEPHGRSAIEPDGHGPARASTLGDTGRDGAGEHAGELPRDEAEHDERSAHSDHTSLYPGAVGGFWRDAEWVPCLDGVARPVKPGLAVLVARTPRGVGGNRAARLKGYGNSIVLPLASTFVSALIDTLVDGIAVTSDASVVIDVVIDAPVVIDVPVDPIAKEPAQSPQLPEWTGPREGETAPSGMLYGRVPGERWPYGPPSAHEPACNLFPHRGSPGGLFCDCAASAADRVENEVSA